MAEQDAQVCAAAALPAVTLLSSPADDAEIPLGATKLGGSPDLPDGFEWPVRPAYPHAAEWAARFRKVAEAPFLGEVARVRFRTPAAFSSAAAL